MNLIQFSGLLHMSYFETPDFKQKFLKQGFILNCASVETIFTFTKIEHSRQQQCKLESLFKVVDNKQRKKDVYNPLSCQPPH